jgi:hypothetical protein
MNDSLEYSVRVLEEAPARVTQFLQGIGAVPMIRTNLMAAGMTSADIEEGRQLLLACLAAPFEIKPDPDTVDARAQRAAVAEIDEWDEPAFARFGATLRRHFPKVHAYVFQGRLHASRGAESVNGVATFLARLDALESGSDPARAASRAEDAQAVALLEKRGLTKAERARLKKLVDTALGPTAPLPVIPSDDSTSARLAKLSALRAWFDEWSETARVVVKRRADLIRLGLASRRSHEEEEPVSPPPPSPATTNGPAAAVPVATR